MMNLIRYSGNWGYILTVLGLVVLFLSLRTAGRLLKAPPPDPRVLREDLNSLLFWGGVAAIIGFLGQCQGAYLALEVIFQATEISPAVVAEGFVISFVPTLFGLGILGYSLSAWGCLRLLASGSPKGWEAPVAFFIGFPILLSGCSGGGQPQGPLELTRGVWSLDAGPDEFLWEFAEGAEGYTCLVHDMVGATKLNETPCLSAELEGSSITVSMDTGVRLMGEMEPDRGRIVGALHYTDGSELEVELPWRSRDEYPALLALGTEDGSSYSYAPPPDRGDGWPVSSAAAEGIDPQALEATVMAISRGEAGILHSLLVARHGRLVFEEYFHGYEPDDLHHLASCTKSISSLLAGLAIQWGSIPGVEVPLLSFFPEMGETAGSGWEDLTLEHLLTMSMALDWSPQEAESLHGSGPEFFQKILSRSVSGVPGEDWAYVSANVNLLAGILHRATGKHAGAFAREALWGPLGIQRWNWDGLKTDGYNLMDGSLRLLPRDMGKIGQLVLGKGVWNGHRVVEEDWIQKSTTRHLEAGEEATGYGYLWWQMEAKMSGAESIPVILANGWGSQFISIVPSLDLVIVTTGGNEYNGKHLAPGELVERILLPGVNGAET